MYWQGGQPQLEGLLLALATGGIGVGHRRVGQALHAPRRGHRGAPRPRLERGGAWTAFRAEFERGEESLERRGLLIEDGRRRAGARSARRCCSPIRSLGPRPGRGLKTTPFHAGVRLRHRRTTSRSGRPTSRTDGVITVFPEGHTDAADAPTLLIRPEPTRSSPGPGREDWTPDGLVAYSKLCTHVGCPVGLYQAGEHLLLCPCHQSTFDVLDGARPVFGPAARSLPQLPLRGRRRRLPRRRRRLLRPAGPGLLGPGPLMTADRPTTPLRATASRPSATRRVRARWLDDRLGAANFARTALDKVFPDHWSFMIGEIALYSLRRAGPHRHLPHVLLRPEPRRSSPTTAATRRCGACR